MPFSVQFAEHGFAEWIQFPENRSSIAGLGYKIDSKSFQPASVLIAFPLL